MSATQTCAYCGAAGPLTVDHVVPLSRWREHRIRRRVLDNKSNRVAACARCNREKGALSPKEWFRLHPEYRGRFLQAARYLSDDLRRIVGLDA